jgi:hypothetical protein
MENTNNLPATMAGMQMAEVQRIMGDAPQTLTINKQSTEKAVQAADALLENARSVGMSDALDGEMARYVDKAKKTIVTMNDRRKPFTQIMDAVKKELTTLEADLKTKIAEVQAQRDGYATMKMEEQRRREREAQEKLAREREAIDLAKSADIGLAENFAEHFREAKGVMLEKFNGAGLSIFDETMGEIESFSDVLTAEVYGGFRPALRAQYHAAEDVKAITSAAMNARFKDDVILYQRGISAYKRELLDKRNSKLAELKEMEAAGAAERERLEAERKQREDAERERLAKEAEEARAKAAAEAETQAAGAAAQAEIAAMAEVGTQEAQVRESYEITVNNPTGNMLIASCWFQNEGKLMTQDKIDRVTFERMRKFCEKHAMSTGEMIDSPFVSYTEVFKAK